MKKKSTTSKCGFLVHMKKKPKKHSLVISIPKTLHSRIFAKNVRLKFRDFHTVKHSVYTYLIYKSQGFLQKRKKKSVKATFSLVNLSANWFHEFFSSLCFSKPCRALNCIEYWKFYKVKPKNYLLKFTFSKKEGTLKKYEKVRPPPIAPHLGKESTDGLSSL